MENTKGGNGNRVDKKSSNFFAVSSTDLQSLVGTLYSDKNMAVRNKASWMQRLAVEYLCSSSVFVAVPFSEIHTPLTDRVKRRRSPVE